VRMYRRWQLFLALRTLDPFNYFLSLWTSTYERYASLRSKHISQMQCLRLVLGFISCEYRVLLAQQINSAETRVHRETMIILFRKLINCKDITVHKGVPTFFRQTYTASKNVVNKSDLYFIQGNFISRF
jgi:hypothetical protein